MSYEIVVRAQELEIVEVIEHGDGAPLEFPQDGGRQMMIDASDVGQIRREVRDALANGAPGGWGIDGVRRHFHFLQKAGIGILEVLVRNAVTAAREGGRGTMVHAEERGFVTALIHPVNEVEEVGFRAAKWIAVLVAIQNAHGFRLTGGYGTGTFRQMRVDFGGGY